MIEKRWMKSVDFKTEVVSSCGW